MPHNHLGGCREINCMPLYMPPKCPAKTPLHMLPLASAYSPIRAALHLARLMGVGTCQGGEQKCIRCLWCEKKNTTALQHVCCKVAASFSKQNFDYGSTWHIALLAAGRSLWQPVEVRYRRSNNRISFRFQFRRYYRYFPRQTQL